MEVMVQVVGKGHDFGSGLWAEVRFVMNGQGVGPNFRINMNVYDREVFDALIIGDEQSVTF